MAIRIRYEAAGVPISEAGVSPAKRKYGQDLVMQQRKYDLETKQMQQQQGFQAQRDAAQQNFILGRDKNQQDFVLGRDAEARRENALAQQEARERQKTALEEQRRFQQGQQTEAQRRRAEEEAIMAKRASLREGMENGEFDDVTVKRLRELDIALMDARAGKSKDGRLDASQQAEAIQKIEAEVEALAKNRLPRKAPLTRQQQLDQDVAVRNGIEFVPNPRGGWDPLPSAKPQGPVPSWEAFQDGKTFKEYRDRAANQMTENGLKPEGANDDEAVNRRAAEIWDIDQKARQAPAAPAQPGVAPGAMAAPQVGQPALPGQPPQVGQQVGQQAAPPAQAPVAAVPNIEPGYSVDGESNKKIVPVHDPQEQKSIDGGFVQVRESDLPVGFTPPVTFKGPKGEPVHYFDPKDMPDEMSNASDQSIVADSGLTDEQFKAAMEQQFSNMGGAQPNQASAQPAVPFSEQQFQNNVPVVGPNGASGNLMPGGVSGVQGNRQFRDQTEMEMALRGAGQPDAPKPVVSPALTDAASAVPATAPVVSPEVGKFFDSKIGETKNEAEKYEFTAVKDLLAKGQSQEVTDAIMVAYGKGKPEERLAAVEFLMSKGVDLRKVAKKPDPKEPSRQQQGYRPPGARY